MESYVGLLRAVNLGGTTQIRMEELGKVVAGLGFHGVRTLLQSGNVVFRGAPASPATIEDRLEAALHSGLQFRTELFVRTASEWRGVIAANPFPEEAKRDPAHLTVAFLKTPPRPEAWSDLRNAIRGREAVRGTGRHAYIVYPDGIGRSKLTPALIERNLETRATSRNWNTILKLDALAATT